jgi:hypothetical protein
MLSNYTAGLLAKLIAETDVVLAIDAALAALDNPEALKAEGPMERVKIYEGMVPMAWLPPLRRE